MPANVDDYPASTATTGVLLPGVAVSARYEQIGDSDWFRFHAEAGQHYNFSGQGGSASLYGPYVVSIYDANGKVVHTPDSTEFSPSTTGDYFVSTTGFEVGNYTIQLNQLIDDYSSDDSNPGVLAESGTTTGVINFNGDTDRFNMQMTAGRIYTLHYSTPPHGVLQLAVAGPDGMQLDTSTVYNPDGSESIVVMPNVSGQYGLTISSVNMFTATPYTLSADASVADDFAGTIDAATPLAIGSSVHGAIQARQDIDTFKLDLQAGTTYALTLDYGDNQAPDGHPYLNLLDAGGSVIGFNSDTTAKLYTFTPTVSGTYYVNMAGYSKGNEAYTLTASLAHDDVGATAATAGSVTVGSSVSGELEAGGGDIDWYAVTLDAGSTYWFNLLGANEGQGTLVNYPYGLKLLRVLDASGHELASTVGQPAYGATAPTLAFVPNAQGTYYVEVSAPDRQTGTYQLQAQLAAPDDYGNDIYHPAAIAFDTPVSGVLEIPSDQDMFHFKVRDGGAFSVKLSTPANTAEVQNLAVTAYNLHGVGITLHQSIAPDGSILYFANHLPGGDSGDYYVAVGEASTLHHAQDNHYTLTVSNLTADTTAPTVVAITPVQGASGVNPGTAIDVTFSETVGQRVLSGITLTDSAGQYVPLLPNSHNLQVDGNHLLLNPQGLMPGSTYTLQLAAGSVQDLAGNPLAGPLSYTFKTAPAVTTGSSGNDYLIGKLDGSTINGGSGIDTVVYNSDATISHFAGAPFTVHGVGAGQVDTLSSIERVLFPSQAVALDIDGNAGQVYRLYQATFDRAPDQAGLGFWIHAMDQGMTLQQTAHYFLTSGEYQQAHSTATTDAQYVDQLYQNVLHRAGDADGIAFWQNCLHNGMSREQVLTGFSESPENQAALIGVIGNGIAYIPAG